MRRRIARAEVELFNLLPSQPMTRRVITALEVTGVSDAWLAAEVGTYKVKVHRWCQGTLPKVTDGLAIAQAFNIPPQVFWGLESELDSPPPHATAPPLAAARGLIPQW